MNLFSAKNKQDPNGPFPATLYSHHIFKYHQNRLGEFASLETHLPTIRVHSKHWHFQAIKEGGGPEDVVFLFEASNNWMQGYSLCCGHRGGAGWRDCGLDSQVWESVFIRGMTFSILLTSLPPYPQLSRTIASSMSRSQQSGSQISSKINCGTEQRGIPL